MMSEVIIWFIDCNMNLKVILLFGMVASVSFAQEPQIKIDRVTTYQAAQSPQDHGPALTHHIFNVSDEDVKKALSYPVNLIQADKHPNASWFLLLLHQTR